MSAIKFQFVQQPTPRTCVHACLSMVTGVPVQELIDRFGDRGLAIECEVAVLIENGIFPDMRFYIAPSFDKGFYLATAPSLNIPGGLHRVVVEVNEDYDFVVHDPNTGRDGVKAYPPNAIEGGEPSLCMMEAIGLNLHMLAHIRRDKFLEASK